MNSDWNRQVLQIVIGNDPLYGPQSVAYNVWVASGDATMLYRVVGIDPSLPDNDDDDADDDDDDDDEDDRELHRVQVTPGLRLRQLPAWG